MPTLASERASSVWVKDTIAGTTLRAKTRRTIRRARRQGASTAARDETERPADALAEQSRP